MKNLFSLLVLVLLLTACGGGGGESPEPAPAPAPTGSGGSDDDDGDPFTNSPSQATSASDNRQDIIDLVYRETYTAPDGFYVDPRTEVENSEIVHLRSETNSYECVQSGEDMETLADVYREQFESSSRQNATNHDFYYEVETTVSNGVGGSKVLYVRAFDCFALNSVGVDTTALEGTVGLVFQGRDFTTIEDYHDMLPGALNTLSQYFYSVYDWGSFTKVLGMSTTDGSEEIPTAAITLALVDPSSDASCDVIEVAVWSHLSEKAGCDFNGCQVVRTYDMQDLFGARLVDGKRVPVDSCDGS